jgi:hypothetical protein
MVGSDHLLWNDATLTLSLREAGNDWLSMHEPAGTGEPELAFGPVGSFPRIKSILHVLSFTSRPAQDLFFGPSNDPQSTIIGGDNAVLHGTIRTGIGAAEGIIHLNDGNQLAGVFAGAEIIMGFVADPNGVIVAETGSIFLTVAGGAGTTFWVKESSPTTSTGWIGK